MTHQGPDQVTVTVAAFGPSFSHELGLFTGPSLADQGPDVAYADRLKAVLDVEADETLGSVIDRAAAEFGVAPGNEFGGVRMSEVITGVVFYRPEDEHGLQRPEPWPDSIRVLDDTGAPSWAVPWRFVRYRELLAASEAGLVNGDPRRPYLWPVIPQGEPTVIGILLLAALWSLKQVLTGALEELGANTLRAALKRINDVNELVETSTEWQERLARPDQFVTYLRQQPRTTEEAAELLHCSPQDAESVLWGMGFGYDAKSGTWIWQLDQPAALIATQLERARTEAKLPSRHSVADAIHDSESR
jgi:hypothetical protein